MTAETTTVSAARPVYRDNLTRILTSLGGIVVTIWLIWGRGWQQILAWDPVLLWFVTLALLTVALLAIGKVGNDRWLGVLINPQFKMSLARLQIVLWTLLVLSAYITIAIHRLSAELTMDATTIAECTQTLGRAPAAAEECGGGAINITFPPELLVAMGISAASFAGASVIQSTKKGKTVDVVSKNDRITVEEDKVTNATRVRDEADQAMQKARIVLDEKTEAAKDGAPGSEMVKAGAEKDYDDAVLAYKMAQL